MISYPLELPLPLQASYQTSINPAVKRSSMSDGWIRQRKTSSNAPDTVTVNWYFMNDEYGLFREFYYNLNEGQDWFLLRMLSHTEQGTEVTQRVVRFQSGKYTEKLEFYDGRYLFKISATLDIQNNDYFVSDDSSDSWNTDTDYNFEFGLSGGVPYVKGKKKCLIVSSDSPSGASNNYISCNSSDKVGVTVYTEALKLGTNTENKILEIQSHYSSLATNTNYTYLIMSRVISSDSGFGVGLANLSDSNRNYGNINVFQIVNNQQSNVSKSGVTNAYTHNPAASAFPRDINRRDIFINDVENNKTSYYCILNNELVYSADMDLITFSANVYQICDYYQNGRNLDINLYSIKAHNSLSAPIPERT